MKKVVELIKALEATTKRTEKTQLLTDAYMTGNHDFFIAAQLAYDQMVNFGVKKVALITDAGELDSESSLTFDVFLSLCKKLSTRKLSGNAARTAINEAAFIADADEWNYFYRRILLKDFKCGVDVKTINGVLAKLKFEGGEKFHIPVFEPQLAHDSANHPKKVKGKKLVDIKFDGVRNITVVDPVNMTVAMFTRNGRPLDNYGEIADYLLKELAPNIKSAVVLDGEIIGESYSAVMTQLKRKSDINTSSERYAVFDMLPLEAFKKGRYDVSQLERHMALMALQDVFKAAQGRIFIVPKLLVDLDTPEGRAKLEEFNQTTLLNGDEGIMLKDPDAPYIIGKGTNWLKWKPFIEVSLTVVGLEDGKPDGKYADVVGNLICEGIDDGKYIKVDCGGGLTDEQRIEWKNNPDLIVGMVVEIIADKMDYVADSDYYSLRFPRFKGFRGLVKGEKF